MNGIEGKLVMDPNDYLDWCLVKNTAKNLVQENQLTCTRLPKKKILKGTKLVNKKLKQCSVVRTYDNFIKCKKKILKNLTEYLDVTEESDITDDHDSDTYNCSKSSCSKDSNVNYTDDCFSWICIEKKRAKDTELKKKKTKSIIDSEDDYDYDDDVKINDTSLPKSLNNSIDSANSTIDKVTRNGESPKGKEKRSLNIENNINKEPSKNVKKVEVTPTINNNIKNDIHSSDEWEDEFIPSDFQGHSTKIFSNTISEVNKQRRKSNNGRRLSKTKADLIIQPRHSDVEEDSENEKKLKNRVNNICQNDSKTDDKLKENIKINSNKSKEKHIGTDNVAPKNLLDETKSMKLVNNLSDTNENKIYSKQMKKYPLKIIGEEQVTKKYKIIDSSDKESNLISKEQNLLCKSPSANKNLTFINEVTECKDERSSDNSEKRKENTNKLCNLNNVNDGEDLLKTDNKTDKTQLTSETEDKDTKNLKSYLVHKRRKLKQMRLISSEDVEDKPYTASNKEKSVKKDKTLISNIMEPTRLPKNRCHLVPSNEDVKINNEDKIHENKKNLILLNKKKSFQQIDLSQLSSDENLNVGNEEEKNSLKTEYFNTNEDEKVCKNKKEAKINKNTKSSNILKYFQLKDINKTSENDGNVMPNIMSSQKNKVNMKLTEIDESVSYSTDDNNEIQSDFKNKFNKCKKSDFTEFTSDESKTVELHASGNHDSLKQTNKILADENKIENKNDHIKEKNKKLLKTKPIASSKDKKKNDEQLKKKLSLKLTKEKRNFCTDGDTDEQSSTIRNKNMIKSSNEKHLSKSPKSRLQKDIKESNKSNNDSVMHSNDVDVDTEKSNISSSKNLTKNKNSKDTDKSNSNNNVAHEIKCNTSKSCASSDTDEEKFKFDDILNYSSSDDEIGNTGKLKKPINYNSQPNEDDREIDVDIMSQQAFKRLKGFKRLDLFKSSEEESDKEEVIECKKLTIAKCKKLQKTNLKSLDDNNQDDKVQEININSPELAPSVNRSSNSNLSETPDFYKKNEEKSMKSTKQINNTNNEESVDENSDETIAISTMQKLSQLKKINFYNHCESSSEDDSHISSNEVPIDNTVPKNAISQKEIDSKIEKSNDLENNIVNSYHLSNINKSFTDKSPIAEVSTQNNKATKSIDNKLCAMKDIKDDKSTNIKVRNSIEEIKQFDKDDRNKIIIGETQESLDAPRVILESQEIFSSLENLNEDLNPNRLDESKETIFDVNNSPTLLVKEVNDTEKIKEISDIVEKDNLIENVCEWTLAFEDLSVDEEIFILDVPKTAFDKNLVGEKLSFSKGILQLGNDRYRAFQRRILPTFPCILKSKEKDLKNSLKILNIRPATVIVTRKKNSIIQTADSAKEKKDKEFEISGASEKKSTADANINETKKTKVKDLSELATSNEEGASASLKIKNSNVISKNDELTEKNSKRKLSTDVDNGKNNDKGSDSESMSDIDDKDGFRYKKCKRSFEMRKSTDLNDIPKKIIIKNHKKSNGKKSKIKNEKTKMTKMKRKDDDCVDKDKDITSDETDKIFSPENLSKAIGTPISSETESAANRNTKSESDNSNFNITVDNAEEMVRAKPKSVNKNKLLKSERKKRNKMFVNSIRKEAIEQIINIVRNNIKFEDSSSSCSSDDSNYRPVDIKRRSAQKHKRHLSSSSEESNKNYFNRSFQILDRSKPQSKKKFDPSLSFQKSQSGMSRNGALEAYDAVMPVEAFSCEAFASHYVLKNNPNDFMQRKTIL